jgi:FlaA1/EpsC-like NDP-sugar epimerase
MVLTGVSENLPDYENVEKNIHKGINLFGTGQLGQSSLEYFFEKNYKIACFLNNSPEKQNKIIHGVNVKGSSGVTNGVILITARNAIAEIKASLKDSNLPIMSFTSWFVIKNILRNNTRQWQHGPNGSLMNGDR